MAWFECNSSWSDEAIYVSYLSCSGEAGVGEGNDGGC